jgi:hypothetical protein
MSKSMKAAASSYARSFAAAALAAFLATGGDIASLNADSLKLILSAGVAAVLPVAMRALNSNDKAFGKGAK